MAKQSALEPQLDDLFQSPLSEFTGRRDELAAALRQKGKAAPAAELKAIKKPTVSAWAVNQLFFRERPLWNALAEAGAALRRTQSAVGHGRAADELRKASKDLMRALTSLRAKAAQLLEASGHAAAEGTLSRIATTLHALAVSEPGAATQPGRLVADIDPPGFDALTTALGSSWSGRELPSRAAAPGKDSEAARPRGAKPIKDREAARPRAAKPRERAKEEKQRARAERAASARRARAQAAAQTALRRAERELASCSRAVTAATNKVVAARQALTAAEAARTVAERAESAARKKAERARRMADQLE
ncbi:MAG TPA: hypothetical protein PLW65_00375 [Pseudomonadota bacterium]|nr:hypothetical protein [Pseudomonadota bacterium]